ncbi:MAG: hypothetical protein H5T86_14355, partial [Armatimonadetes bacterium]|nr:hypothetical protein [Armatimonadota bacterium]
MRALVGAALLVVFASAAAAFTNAYEPRVLEIAGRGGDGSVHFAWMGADLRVDGPGGIVAGEMRLKVWGDGGGPVQVLLCIDLRPVEAHPKPPEETIANARLMPVATLFDGELQRRPDARAERVKFRFR